jgi:biopolymer transport protein ExbD
MAASASEDEEDAITSINVTPLVDIVLVLLIIFMMTASYIVAPAIKVELPKAATAESVVQSMLALVITKEGDLFLNNSKATEDELRSSAWRNKRAKSWRRSSPPTLRCRTGAWCG